MSDRDWRIEVSEAKLSGKRGGYHWKAISADGEVLDFLFTPTRDEASAQAFFDKSLSRRGQRGIELSVARLLKQKSAR